MFVYTVSVIWQRDSGDCGNQVVGVYSNLKDAMERFGYEINYARQDFRDVDTEETKLLCEDMSWSIWERGEYCYNHCDIVVKEHQVQ